MILSSIYETHSGIYDHSRSHNRPLANVAFHPAEDPIKDSPLFVTISLYAERNILSLFGLDLVEFLQLPSDYCEMLVEIADNVAKRKNKDAEALNKETASLFENK